ncbi:hypothetical protein [Rickettsia endosymbiont of Ceutorhynchus obstrictus]|uniref:hypothetical protein n=1 Tax=Rickettsia endosymbiont of Ceutorhynchus obstrictus TaxID=3066249 RepID=UPI003132F0D0
MPADKDAQLENAISAIKAQLTATTNPAELARLGGEAAGLLSSTNNPDLIKEITNLQASIATKEETAQNRVSSGINAQNIEAEALRQNPQELAEQQKLENFNIEHERLNAQHETFLKTADKYLAERQKENEKLEELLKDIRAGKEIDPERLNSFKKTPEQTQAEQQELESLRKHQAEANKHHADALAHEEEMQKERAKLAKELAEKLNAIKDLPPAEREKETLKLKPLENRLAQQDAKLADFKPKLQKTAEIKATADKVIEETEKRKEQRKDIEKEIEKEIEKHKETNPQKYSVLSKFGNLSEVPEEAIKADKISKNSIVAKEEPSINQKPTPTNNQNPIKESHTIGDRIVDLNEQLKSRPALKGEIEKITGELKIGLQNQKNTSVNSKENEVNKQIAKNTQQNKNDGHTR